MWWWRDTGTGCPERLWMPPPWKCSRSHCVELWAIRSSMLPMGEVLERDHLLDPSNSNHSVIYGSMIPKFRHPSENLWCVFLPPHSKVSQNVLFWKSALVCKVGICVKMSAPHECSSFHHFFVNCKFLLPWMCKFWNNEYQDLCTSPLKISFCIIVPN